VKIGAFAVCRFDVVYIKNKEKIMTITKESIIGDVLDIDVGAAKYFMEIGMHCLGCPASRGETIAMASAVHGIDPDALIDKLNEYFKGRE